MLHPSAKVVRRFLLAATILCLLCVSLGAQRQPPKRVLWQIPSPSIGGYLFPESISDDFELCILLEKGMACVTAKHVREKGTFRR